MADLPSVARFIRALAELVRADATLAGRGVEVHAGARPVGTGASFIIVRRPVTPTVPRDRGGFLPVWVEVYAECPAAQAHPDLWHEDVHKYVNRVLDGAHVDAPNAATYLDVQRVNPPTPAFYDDEDGAYYSTGLHFAVITNPTE